eukprot:gene3745-4001_t
MLIVVTIILAELSFFYAGMLMIPLQYLHRRPAIYGYAALNLLIVLYQLGSVIAFIADNGSDNTNCAVTICFSFSEFLQIFIILYAFGEDSRFWQGLYVNSEVNLNEPLLGIWDMNKDAVDMVTQSVFHLERKVVPIIPFSHLKVDTSMYFSGGTARVYKGTYSKEEVAIKFLFCIELTPDRIVDFCNEATMLNSLQHPNIVKCYGVAIMPPAISLVTEFCHYGSLFDFLHSIEVDVAADKPMRGTGSGSEHRSRTSTAQSVEIMKSPQLTRKKILRTTVLGGEDSSDSSVVKSPMMNVLDENNSSSNTNPIMRASTESTISKSQRNTDNSINLRVSFQENYFDGSYDDRSSGTGGDNNNNNQYSSNNILKFLDISAIDNIDAASKLADALASEYNANLSYRGSKSAHFYSKNNLLHQPPWSALSATYKISKELGPPTTTTSVKMTNAAAVMLTREMGFGLGPANSVPSENILKSPSTSKRKSFKSGSKGIENGGSRNARSRLLSVGNASTHSIGNLLPLAVRLSMMRDCCAGLAHLHSKGIMHCDIKSLNFLVTSSLKVKLADLGEARIIQDLDVNEKKLPSNINWSSPETLKVNREPVTVNQSADVWSIGMVMFEILSGEIPFDTNDHRNMIVDHFLEELKSGVRPSLPREFSHITWIKKLLDSTWEYDATRRPTASRLVQILEDAIMQK